MKTFRVTKYYSQSLTHEIEAESKEVALKKFDKEIGGEWGDPMPIAEGEVFDPEAYEVKQDE